MKIEESRISKANVCPYRGSEIPRWDELGLNPDKIYKLFRDPNELQKAASTFDGKPLLIRHIAIDAEEPQKNLWVGTLGKTTYEAPYLVTRPLMVLTKEAIDLIESEAQKELSAAYRYDAVMEPGTYMGERYDGRMVNIRGNHVAIVSEGRAGPDVHVADELPLELRSMKHRKLIDNLAPYLKPGVDLMALDKALGEVPAESVLSLDEEEMEAAEDAALAEKREKEGEDASLTDEEKEEAYERARDRKAKDKKAKDKKAKDMKAKDKKAKDAAAKNTGEIEGEDADPDHREDFEPAKDSVTKDEMNAAVRAAVKMERERSKELAIARDAVRPIVGPVSMALDSAEDVYRFALKQAGVKVDGVHPSAYPVLLEMAVKKTNQPAPIAMDASTASLLDIDAIFRAH